MLPSQQNKDERHLECCASLGGWFPFFHARMEETTGMTLQEQILYTDVGWPSKLERLTIDSLDIQIYPEEVFYIVIFLLESKYLFHRCLDVKG